ncbi:MAG: hypothetical protein RL380_1446 [Verrucomicrobiota bacterium]|jgi:hypothetical protein
MKTCVKINSISGWLRSSSRRQPCRALSLTPALSRREREKHSPRLEQTDAAKKNPSPSGRGLGRGRSARHPSGFSSYPRAQKFFAIVSLCWLALTARAQTITTLRTNGPADNRINLIFFAEGYRTNQLAQFTNDAALAASNLLATAPYSDYSNYFNAYAISVPSTNSGANHSASGNTNLTYFSATFNSVSNSITIPPNDRSASYNLGKGKIANLLTNFALYTNQLSLATDLLPKIFTTNRLLIVLVNDAQSGGSGTPTSVSDTLAFCVASPVNAQTVVHETGHAFASLADEYTNAYPGFVPVERANATTNLILANIPWKNWIDSGVADFGFPTPTTNVSLYSAVGVWQGAQYNVTGWYRPKLDCIMNQLGTVGFCEICSEAIIKSCYQGLRPFENIFPATNNPTLTTTQALTFSLTKLQPPTHNLLVQWFTNGVAAPNQTNTSFTFLPSKFTNGNHTVRAAVRDTTALVLNDPAKNLSNSVVWNVAYGVTSLQLTNPRWLTNGQFSCTVTGTALNGLVLQASTNLNLTNAWTPIATNALTNGVFNFTNNPGALPRRFYRALGL